MKRSSYGVDATNEPAAVGGIDQFIVCAIVTHPDRTYDDSIHPNDALMPVIEHRSNGQSFHMTYKSRGGAVDGLRRARSVFSERSSDFNQSEDVSELVFFDKRDGSCWTEQGIVPLVLEPGEAASGE